MVFLDTNVFVYAFEFPNSNSRLIIDLLNEDRIEAIVSERVFKEVYRSFRRFYSKELADEYRVSSASWSRTKRGFGSPRR